MNVRMVIILLCIVFAVSPVFGGEKTELKTDKDKLSYALGADMGSNLKKFEIDIDADLYVKGMKDALSGNVLLTDQEIRTLIMALQKDVQTKQQEKMKAQAEKNKKDGEAFLAENKKKEGVKTLPSGLQYKVITEGKGATPKATDTVTVHYKGTLTDGTEFDSSYKRNAPATFPVNGVIKGWTEALQLMKEGSKWQLFIPANLAYGESGRPGIPPNSVLIFDVELVKIGAMDKSEEKKPEEKKAEKKKEK
ncbi:MAG TPA: FKBP-type peptidyl-prolyl cis-trans isomerase [Nitrospirota bacterium]|nr:FKBP-type peptidyl-prolyl cis-trans isomerase [Nitrospirota bacterium]